MRQIFPSPEEVDPVDAYGRLDWVESGRPAVRLNMIASVDGAAWIQGRSGALGGPADKALFAILRSLADVVLVGAGTARTERYGPARLDDEARARRRQWGLSPVPPIAIVTRSCRMEWQTPFFTEAEQRPIVVTGSSANADDRARAEEVADVIVAGDGDVDLVRTIDALGQRGHHNVLCEGGPGVAAQVAAAGLLDEICLTLSPTLAAGDARRILDGPLLQPAQVCELSHVLEADGFLFLRYRRC
jgi:riboflavin biosynthesis pyrimidine reductase